jgi:hypothetical protein
LKEQEQVLGRLLVVAKSCVTLWELCRLMVANATSVQEMQFLVTDLNAVQHAKRRRIVAKSVKEVIGV